MNKTNTQQGEKKKLLDEGHTMENGDRWTTRVDDAWISEAQDRLDIAWSTIVWIFSARPTFPESEIKLIGMNNVFDLVVLESKDQRRITASSFFFFTTHFSYTVNTHHRLTRLAYIGH